MSKLAVKARLEMPSAKGLEAYIKAEGNESGMPNKDVPYLWKGLKSCFDAFGSEGRDGCVRDGGIFGDVADLEGEIKSMFYTYWSYLRNLAVTNLGMPLYDPDEGIKIYVDVSCEDTTGVLLVQEGLRNIVLIENRKAWHFCWETPSELEEELKSNYEAIVKGIKRKQLELWLARIETRDGENEYDSEVFIRAKDEEEARKQGDKIAQTWYEDDDGEHTAKLNESGWFEMVGDYRWVRCRRVTKIDNLEDAISVTGGIFGE